VFRAQAGPPAEAWMRGDRSERRGRGPKTAPDLSFSPSHGFHAAPPPRRPYEHRPIWVMKSHSLYLTNP